MKALLSVYDKSGVVDFAREIHRTGVELISTGGTHRTLSDAGLPVQQVSEFTGSPEILDGRVKTLHPIVHGGILARRDNPDHMSELSGRGMDTIDLVAVNLYPFAATIARPGVTLDDALENIDIGGPTMIRAAAKNFPFVAVVVDPADYPWVAEQMAGDGLTIEERQRLAQKAFQHVAFYDTIIAGYLRKDDPTDLFPQEFTLAYRRIQGLRYGENPHQQAAFYGESLPLGIAGAKQLHGGSFPTTTSLTPMPLGARCRTSMTRPWRLSSTPTPVALPRIRTRRSPTRGLSTETLFPPLGASWLSTAR